MQKILFIYHFGSDSMGENLTTKTEEYAGKITRLSTVLLMIAVLAFFFNTLFGQFYSFTDGGYDAFILGSIGANDNNMIVLKDMGGIFALFSAFLFSIQTLCAGLSFAAVCFDENKNIWFRVVSVAALMLIMYGGLGIF